MGSSDYYLFEHKLGYTFVNKLLLMEALTHSTYAYEHMDEGILENERLEFLGDSVLGLTITYQLLQVKPLLPEGKMSRIRAQIVREDTLYKAALSLGLTDFLRLGKGEEQTGGREKPSNLSNAVEAVFGAVYLDGGFDKAFEVVWRIMKPYFDLALRGKLLYDYKTTLIERVQAMGVNHRIEFVVTDEEGPVHDRLFTVQVKIDGTGYGTGVGSSKKAAEQRAASETLNML